MVKRILLLKGKLPKQAHELALNSIWSLMTQVIELFSMLLVTVTFTSLASKEIFGSYQYLLAIIGMVSIISLPGLNTSSLRSIALGYEGTYTKGTLYTFLASLLGTPVILAISFYMHQFSDTPHLTFPLLIAAFIFPLYYSFNTWIVYLQAKNQFKRYFLINALINILQCLLIICILLVFKDNVAIPFLATLVFTSVINFVLYNLLRAEISNKDENNGWVKQGLSLTLLTFVSNTYNNLDKILIGYFLSPQDLAIYAIAIMFPNKLKILFKSFMRALFPRMVTKSNVTLRNAFMMYLPGLTLTLVLLTTFMYIVIPPLQIFLFGDKYIDSIFYTKLYLVTIPMMFLMTLFSHIFVAMQKEVLLSKIQLISLSINVLLYILLIPRYGLVGAIISSIIYYLIFTLSSILNISLKSSIHNNVVNFEKNSASKESLK